jgi:hypothetical protein
MTESDIYIKVIETIGYKMIDEHTVRTYNGENVNMIEFNNGLSIINLIFNYKTDEVICHDISIDSSVRYITKESFYNEYIDLFRDIKLENIIE